jgi:chorismate mutase / prephenate dehydrogenase
MSDDLRRLRDALAGIDQKLLELVAERSRLAIDVGEAKRRLHLPTRDFQQEREVLERARATAGRLGISPRLAESLVLELIASAVAAQERQALTSAGGGTGRRALVIGGAGRMGRWFASFLGSQGFAVEIADPLVPPGEPASLRDWRESALDHDVIVISAPLLVTNEILLEMAGRPPRGLVFDVGSLKTPLRRGLQALAAAGAQVTSVHPMFGPDTELLSGRNVIFVDLGAPAATQAARDLFSSTSVEQVTMDLESHDRLVAYVLGLSHALNIAFFTALAESGEAAGRLATLSSTTFDAQLEVAARVAGENPQLYFEIQSLNDYGTEALTALLYATERIRSVVRAGDEQAFTRLMERGREYLSVRAAAPRPGG